MQFDGDDDDDKKKAEQHKHNGNDRNPSVGDYNLPDEIGERIGEENRTDEQAL